MSNLEGTTQILIDSADLKILLDAARIILAGHKPSKVTTSGDYLSFQEFMQCTGIKRTLLYSLLGQGRIKSIKKGRKYKIPVSELDRYWNDPSFK